MSDQGYIPLSDFQQFVPNGAVVLQRLQSENPHLFDTVQNLNLGGVDETGISVAALKEKIESGELPFRDTIRSEQFLKKHGINVELSTVIADRVNEHYAG